MAVAVMNPVTINMVLTEEMAAMAAMDIPRTCREMEMVHPVTIIIRIKEDLPAVRKTVHVITMVVQSKEVLHAALAWIIILATILAKETAQVVRREMILIYPTATEILKMNVNLQEEDVPLHADHVKTATDKKLKDQRALFC
jgi:hypothetical protein